VSWLETTKPDAIKSQSGKPGKDAGKVNVLIWGDLSPGYQSNSDRDVRLRRQGSADAIVPCCRKGRAEHREDEYNEQFAGQTKKTECLKSRHCCASETGEACGDCAEGRAVHGTRRRKIWCQSVNTTLGEPPDADPHVRWCERERLAAAPYSINCRQE